MAGQAFCLGFTLAEVLITLGIIGAVAVLTIPNLIAEHQKLVTVNKLKKAYSTLSNAITMSENDNGPMKDWPFETSQYTVDNGQDVFSVYILPYLNKIGKCKGNQCGQYTSRMNNIRGESFLGRIVMHVLPDGTAYSYFTTGTTYSWIFIDINGPKDPNKLGRDIFMADIKSGRLKFVGEGASRNYLLNGSAGNGGYGCSKDNSYVSAGGTCGALIQYDGWEINYDW